MSCLLSAVCVMAMMPLGAGVLAADAPAPANSVDLTRLPVGSDIRKLLQDAQRAQTSGDLNFALIQLKNAVRLAPRNGEVRALLGMAILKSGDTHTAERELRQALADGAPENLVIPAILDTMVVRGEAKELLSEFPDSGPRMQSAFAPDILRGRAEALQLLGRTAEANNAMTRALALRRDVRGLTARAKLAADQGDSVLAQQMIDEALKLAPTNEEALLSQIALYYRSGELDKATERANEFIRRVPDSVIARVIRIEVHLQMNRDAAAKDDLDELLTVSPDSSFGPYYRGVLLARKNQFLAAWHEVQNLKPEFVLSQPGTAMMVSEIAIGSGNMETANAFLAALVSRRPDFAPARIRLASVQLSLRDPLSALRTLDPLKSSDDPQIQALLGQANLQLGRFSESIGALQKAIASADPQASDSLKMQLARSAFQFGDSALAIRNLEDLQARQPGNWNVAVPLISTLVEAANWKEALAVVERAGKSAGRTPLTPFYRGRVLGAKGDLAAAQAAFTDALAMNPKFIPALYFRSHVLAARGNLVAAKADLQKIIAQDRTNSYAYIALAEIARYNEGEAQAAGYLNAAVKAAPKDTAPRLALANLQANAGKLKDARSTLDALLLVSPRNPAALIQIGTLQFRNGDIRAAVDTYRSLAAAYPTASGMYVLLAKALNATKDHLAAIDAARRAVELSPYSPEIRALLVDYLMAGGRQDEALAQAREFATARPSPEADIILTNTLYALKRVDEAYSYLNSRMAAKPDRLLAERLSEFAASRGDRKKALAVLTDWLSTHADDFEVRGRYASLLLQIGDSAGARKEFEALLKQRPEDPLVLNNLSWAIKDEDPARALQLASLAAKVAPDSSEVMDTLAWLKFQGHDTEGALSLLSRAHDLDQDNPEIGYHFAVALDARGKRAEAKQMLKSIVDAKSNFSDRAEAEQLLARW